MESSVVETWAGAVVFDMGSSLVSVRRKKALEVEELLTFVRRQSLLRDSQSTWRSFDFINENSKATTW